MNRLLVSAAHKSSGKTTVTLGLCAALSAQGQRVQPFKKGPDYIDPMWLAQASGRPCYNLDPFLMTPAQIRALFGQHAGHADISIVEGNKGLYDGLSLDGSNSNAALAHLLELPVLLVIDARGMTRGIAPLLLGYQAFDRNLRIGGVILNRLGGSRHEAKLRAVIEHYTDLPVLGAIAEDEELAVAERHLGLMPSNEHAQASEQVQRIGARIAAQVDLAAVRALAASASPLQAEAPPAPPSFTWTPRVRIAIAPNSSCPSCRPTRPCARKSPTASKPACPPTPNAAASCTWRAPSAGRARRPAWWGRFRVTWSCTGSRWAAAT